MSLFHLPSLFVSAGTTLFAAAAAGLLNVAVSQEFPAMEFVIPLYIAPMFDNGTTGGCPVHPVMNMLFPSLVVFTFHHSFRLASEQRSSKSKMYILNKTGALYGAGGSFWRIPAL